MRMVVAGILLFYICGSVAMVTTPTGNRCFTCSFTVNKPWMKTECVNNTEQISIHDDSRPCKNYCYTEERFNIRTKQVDSVFRSCRDYPKNGCSENDGFVTCTYSCMGSLCNNISVGTDHVTFCDNFDCSKAATQNLSILVVISCVFASLLG